MRYKSLILVSTALVAAVVVGYLGYVEYLSASSNEPFPSEQELPSPVILNRTKDLEEVQAFLSKYPDSYTIVSRNSDFEVSHYMSECTFKDEPCVDDPSVVEPYIGLKVRLDREGYPTSSVLLCLTETFGQQHRIEDNIIESLDKDICQFR